MGWDRVQRERKGGDVEWSGGDGDGGGDRTPRVESGWCKMVSRNMQKEEISTRRRRRKRREGGGNTKRGSGNSW